MNSTFAPFRRLACLLAVAAFTASGAAVAQELNEQRMAKARTCGDQYDALKPQLESLESEKRSLEIMDQGIELRRTMLQSGKSWMAAAAYNKQVDEFNAAVSEANQRNRTLAATARNLKKKSDAFNEACEVVPLTQQERDAFCGHPINRSFCEYREW